MRKTVTITIGGALFHIEEEAYRSLDQYLLSIRQHFATYQDHEEIVSDIEGRIAEEFGETLRDKKRAAVSQTDVDELIARMGTVADFQEFAGVEQSPAGPQAAGDEQRRPRLYRDADDVILGGVSSGIAKYLGIDPVIIRLAFGLSILLGGFGVLLYVILWAFLPVARTPSEKVEMTQGRVTLSAIEQRINQVVTSEKSRSTFRRIITLPLEMLRRVFQVIGAVLRVVLPVLLRLIGLLIAIAAAAGIAGVTFLYFALLLDPGSPYIGFPLQEAVGGGLYVLLLSSGYLIVLLPLILILLLGAGLLVMRRVVSGMAVAGMACLWLAAGVTGAVTGFMAGPELEQAVERHEETRADAVTRSYDLSDFQRVEAGSNIDVAVMAGTGFSVRVTGAPADLETPPAEVKDGTLILHPRFGDEDCLIFCIREEMDVAVTMPVLTAAFAFGTARLDIRGFETDELRLRANGAARLHAEADARLLYLEADGVPRVTLVGSGAELFAEMNGPARLEAYEFPVREATLELNGPARAHIDASQFVRGEINGPGRIRYRNEPALVEVEVFGPGSVGRGDEDYVEE